MTDEEEEGKGSMWICSKIKCNYWSLQLEAGCLSDHRYFYSYTNVLACSAVKVLKQLAWCFWVFLVVVFFFAGVGDSYSVRILGSNWNEKPTEIQWIMNDVRRENYSISISKISKPIAAQQINDSYINMTSGKRCSYTTDNVKKQKVLTMLITKMKYR